MYRKMLGLVLTVVLFAGVAVASNNPFGQERTKAGPTIEGAPTADLAGLLQRQGLFSPSRLQTWSSYSFGMSAGGGTTTSAGLLVQHLQYQISKPLTLYMELGLLHNPLSMAGSSVNGPSQASFVIPALDLIYRPTENMMLSVHFSQTQQPQYQTPWWARTSGYAR